MGKYEVEPSQAVGGAQLSSCKQFTAGLKQGRHIFNVCLEIPMCGVEKALEESNRSLESTAEQSVSGDFNSVQASRELDTICQVKYEGHRDCLGLRVAGKARVETSRFLLQEAEFMVLLPPRCADYRRAGGCGQRHVMSEPTDIPYD